MIELLSMMGYKIEEMQLASFEQKILEVVGVAKDYNIRRALTILRSNNGCRRCGVLVAKVSIQYRTQAIAIWALSS